jgi:hypothetical protein
MRGLIAKEFLLSKGINPDEIYEIGTDEVVELLEEYHQAKLRERKYGTRHTFKERLNKEMKK